MTLPQTPKHPNSDVGAFFPHRKPVRAPTLLPLPRPCSKLQLVTGRIAFRPFDWLDCIFHYPSNDACLFCGLLTALPPAFHRRPLLLPLRQEHTSFTRPYWWLDRFERKNSSNFKSAILLSASRVSRLSCLSSLVSRFDKLRPFFLSLPTVVLQLILTNKRPAIRYPPPDSRSLTRQLCLTCSIERDIQFLGITMGFRRCPTSSIYPQ